MPRTHAKKVTRRQWYALGGFKNPACFRKADNRGFWRYYVALDYAA